MSLTAGLDRFQQAHPAAGFPLAVVYKFADDQGGYLAALMSYYGFLSLFPLMLLLVTLLGFVLQGDPQAQQRVLMSTLSQFPIVGDQIRNNVASLRGSGLGLTVGILGSLYGGVGVAQAGQNAMNVLWAVPRNRRPNPVKSRLRSLYAVLGLGTGVVLTTVLSGLFAAGSSFGRPLGAVATLLALSISVAGNTALFLLGFRFLTAQQVAFRHLVPGAVTAAVAWQALQAVGVFYVGNTLRNASQTYGLFGLVLGLLGWLYLGAFITVLAAELNVVRARRLWPRALLTPFTDDVTLTPADERNYASAARAQRSKGFETIDVSFNPDDRG